MALTPPLYYANLAAFRAAGLVPFGGAPFDKLAWAIATAMTQWGPTVVFQGVTVGTAGAGAITTPATRIFLPPNPLIMIAGLASAGMVGTVSAALGTVVGLAIPATISQSGNYAGVAYGVGTGSDVSRVVSADQAALYGLLLPLLGPGSAAPQKALGLSRGIASLLLTATGTGTVVGPPSMAPASGSSTSVMV
jgi:hypothetical protein